MMISLYLYVLKANLAFSVLFLAYWLLFKNTTFHRTNRLILLFILFISVVSPFFNFSFVNTPPQFISPDYWIYVTEEIPQDWELSEMQHRVKPMISLSTILLGSYALISVFLLLRFFLQIKKIVYLRKDSIRVSKKENFYLTKHKGKVPFTFFKWIFIPSDIDDFSNKNMVLRHEKAHANQLHTLDIILVELYCIVFWFNPFVFLLKRSLKTVHEYLADEAAVEERSEQANYLHLLVEGVDYTRSIGLSSNFYWLTIKKRINMITKNKSPKIRRLSYLLILPVLALIIQSFSGFNIRPLNKEKLIPESEVPRISPIENKNVRKSSGYGMRMHPTEKVKKMHNGVDFAADIGTPVVATADGVVVKVEFKQDGKGYGRVIIIQHDEEYSTLYSQLSEFKVQVEDKVKLGQVIGLVGSSGMSTGPHLHYEVRKNGKPVNPEDFIDAE